MYMYICMCISESTELLLNTAPLYILNTLTGEYVHVYLFHCLIDMVNTYLSSSFLQASLNATQHAIVNLIPKAFHSVVFHNHAENQAVFPPQARWEAWVRGYIATVHMYMYMLAFCIFLCLV